MTEAELLAEHRKKWRAILGQVYSDQEIGEILADAERLVGLDHCEPRSRTRSDGRD